MQASILVPTVALISISNEQLRTASASSMNVAEGRKAWRHSVQSSHKLIYIAWGEDDAELGDHCIISFRVHVNNDTFVGPDPMAQNWIKPIRRNLS